MLNATDGFQIGPGEISAPLIRSLAISSEKRHARNKNAGPNSDAHPLVESVKFTDEMSLRDSYFVAPARANATKFATGRKIKKATGCGVAPAH
jgi:hypothetical protein